MVAFFRMELIVAFCLETMENSDVIALKRK